MPIEIKDGKIKSRIRNKWLVLTPEEKVRQEYANILIDQYKYDPKQIDEEIDVTGMYSLKRRPDFVIWRTIKDKQDNKAPFIIVECKADYVTINKKTYEQGELYARTTDAPFFVTHNNNETKYWRVKKEKMPGYIEEIEDIPKAQATDKEVQEILSRLKVFKENEFADLLHSCHNIIRNREKLDPAAAFDEIAKVLFMKVYAERKLKADMKGNIFTLDYIEKGEEYNPDYLYDIFEKTKVDFGKDKIFAKDEKINLKVNTIKSIVEKLEKYNLSATSTDVKGIAFEKFLGRTFRGEIGQFFTPRKVVEFMVEMIQPKEGDIICDPASGSGGFLIRFFETLKEQINYSIDQEYKIEKEKIEKRKDLSAEEKAKELVSFNEKLAKELDSDKKNSRLWKLSNRCVYGVDANERMARTSKMNMIMHGDGHGGIHHHDGFLNVNGIFEERFDIILTNPPFGQNVDNEDEIQKNQIEIDEEVIDYYKKIYGAAYEQSQEKITNGLGKPILSLFDLPKNNQIKTELLFIERCITLLKPSGKLGIVLPEGVFNTSSVQYVRDFVEDRAFVNAIISLPQETFESTGAKVKASLLFLQKYSVAEKEKWNKILRKNYDLVYSKNAVSIENLKSEIEEANGNLKKELKSKLKDLLDNINKLSRQQSKKEWNYNVFIQEAAFVGINAQGDDIEANELPSILEKYKQFNSNPKLVIEEEAQKDIEERNTFIADYSDLFKWSIPPKLLLNIPNPNSWKIFKVKDLVKQFDDKVKVEPDNDYDMVGIRLYGQGLFYRETVNGSEISAKWLYPLQENAFIYTRLFAWRGTFGIVTKEFLNHYVSNEFPQFIADKEKILPEYLFFLFTQDFVIRAVKAASGGSAAVSRNRFKEEDFLEFEIPVPDVTDQQKIVDYYLLKKKDSDDLIKQAENLLSETKNKIGDFIKGDITLLQENKKK